jgi:predicted DNA-binding ArsR family transcriptional regulator
MSKEFPENIVILKISLTIKEGLKEIIETNIPISSGHFSTKYVEIYSKFYAPSNINFIESYYKKGLNKFLYYSLCEVEKIPEIRETILNMIKQQVSSKLNYLNELNKHLDKGVIE